METIALLGVMAGFLTHEMKRLVHDLNKVISKLEMQNITASITKTLEEIKRVRDEITGQIQFASTYISNVQTSHIKNLFL